jgi:peroxiredoxin
VDTPETAPSANQVPAKPPENAPADDQSKAEAEQRIRKTVEKQQAKQLDKARKDAIKPFASRKRELQRAIDAGEGHRHVAADRIAEGLKSFKKAGGVSPLYLAQLQARCGKAEEAIKALDKQVEQHKNEILPLVTLVTTHWELKHRKKAQNAFEKLRAISGPIQLESPVFERLVPIARELGWPDDWRVSAKTADDVGERPDLDSLGPFRWKPSAAPEWTLSDVNDQQHALSQYRGRPLIVIFYLGSGCLHCAEQLQAFAPQTEAFSKAGLELIAISSDDAEGLKDSHKGYEKGPFPFPLLSDSDLSIFKAYRAHDDFEKQPLHGTFLIDKQGNVRWQDISYEPFMDHAFLLREANRLLQERD